MRIRISHETRYHYDTPTHGVIQTLRLTPRNHDGQFVADWRIDVSEDCRLDVHEDAFGNITHTFSAEGPFRELSVHVEGEVDVQDTAGLVRGTPDLIAAGAVAMLIGTAANAVHLWMLTRRAESAPAADAALSSVSPRQEGRARP